MPGFSVTVTPYEREGSNIKGFACIYFENSFIVNNINIVQGKGKIFVSMPSYKTKQVDEQGKPIYQDVCYPVTKGFREKLYNEIISEYEKAKDKGNSYIAQGKSVLIVSHSNVSVNPGRMINIFMNEQDAISMFEQDMKKAKWQTVVSLPSGELRETENQVFEILDEADSRGVDIKMKSNDYAKLPEQWKAYCVGTENATFPLIIIDDEVVWYGLPTAKWQFQVDKTTSMITVVHSMVRIKGKNTVEMIKALTDIETVVVGQNIRKLDNKKSKLVTNSFAASSGNLEDNGSILNYGLGAFVEEKEFCPKCKNHMILAKNARGTAYLKCSNKACKETKYLTVDLMNWYINSHNIKCPKRDGGELKGGLGKYGPYVRCNCGHFLKPDEI